MYTVVVADDEEEIRRGIVRKVDWESIGFRVVGQADNGVDALELVEKLEPDLLLTDIKMPFLSGIELARQVREVRPTVQIAFLSGHDDFTYAQQAIQYNIISYMLKPISSSELTKELVKIRQIIDKKFEEFSSSALIQETTEKTEFMLPLLLDGFREGMADSGNEELIEGAISCGLLRSKTSGALSYVVIATSIKDEQGGNCTTRASVNAIDMILKKYVRYASCYLQGRIISVLAATPAGFAKYLHILVEEIVQSVNRIMKLTCSVGISREVETLNECRECYLEAMNAVSYSNRDKNNVHFIADEERVEKLDQETIQKTVNDVENLLRGGSMGELEKYLDEFSRNISSGILSPIMANFLIAQIVAVIFRVVYTVAGDDAVERLHQYFPFTNITVLEQLTETFSKYSELCINAKELISEQRKKSSEILCDKAIEMIQTDYANQELSLVSVSEAIAVSPNYLSALIKKSTGNTFVEILTQRRIEKAKELLLSTSMKIWEITEQCGYKDQHYFSYCFKKMTGVSPNQCRREHEG